ncbi:G2 mitotic specific cyclin 1 [Tubulinosema ratisbonensis]|uniref:G2 mitotic specific cyclin 1 n=1 Tax=Tubulinosema ratisbonensis TaxID=291195 RepID=A0A437AJL8_9MICR|nr:G2 mitotic specific cyclin 1 [Tubulinosema ratisbonensis]
MKFILQDITNIKKENIILTIKKSNSRKKLLRWLYEVVTDFKYSTITFTKAVFILDKFIHKKGLNLSNYQLIGISSLYVSAKYEEKNVLSIKDYEVVTDNSFTSKDILSTELEILKILDFNLNFPLPHDYVTESELEKLNIALSKLEKRDLIYGVISYTLEKEDRCEGPYIIYLKSIRILSDILYYGIDKDISFYLSNCINYQCLRLFAEKS